MGAVHRRGKYDWRLFAVTVVNVKIRMYIFFNLRMYKNIKISVYELLFLRKIIL